MKRLICLAIAMFLTSLMPYEMVYIFQVSYSGKSMTVSQRNYAFMIGNEKCLGYRDRATNEFQWITYSQTLKRIENFASGLIELGLAASNTTLVAFYSANRPEVS